MEASRIIIPYQFRRHQWRLENLAFAWIFPVTIALPPLVAAILGFVTAAESSAPSNMWPLRWVADHRFTLLLASACTFLAVRFAGTRPAATESQFADLAEAWELRIEPDGVLAPYFGVQGSVADWMILNKRPSLHVPWNAVSRIRLVKPRHGTYLMFDVVIDGQRMAGRHGLGLRLNGIPTNIQEEMLALLERYHPNGVRAS